MFGNWSELAATVINAGQAMVVGLRTTLEDWGHAPPPCCVIFGRSRLLVGNFLTRALSR
jgi:hypothetical protein